MIVEKLNVGLRFIPSLPQPVNMELQRFFEGLVKWANQFNGMETGTAGETPGYEGPSGGGSTGGGGGTGVPGMNLDYLGEFAEGPVYNDGDIVIGEDGIAYMCVVDGTTTPPEPWAGGGIATSDATFWTVNPHPGLAHERALSSLANGYVKSTGGEPSTVAAIPPGDLPPFIAYTNVVNQFTRSQRISNAGGDIPRVTMSALGEPLNAKTWEINVLSQNLNFWALSDDETSVLASVSISRTGALSAPGGLNASQLATGTVNTARLGSGTANSSTFLRGDNTWQTIGGVPSGAVVFFQFACPPGYTRIAAWDGYYVRMGSVHQSGGAGSHSHGAGSLTVPAHSHGDGNLQVDSHNHGSVTVGFGISGTTGGGGGHDHGFSGRTGGESGGAMNVDGGASGNMTRSPHTHDFSGTTDGVGNHSHSFSGSGSGSGATGNASPNVSGTTANSAAMGVSGDTDGAANNPLFIDFLACMKD